MHVELDLWRCCAAAENPPRVATAWNGGAFGYDFEIARVLASESDWPIDRVFTIAFPDRAAADRFFADPDYLAVRRAWFEPAVAAVTAIASFDEPAPARG